MKKLLLPLLLSMGVPAAACPNLAGNYSCVQKDGLGGVQGFSMMIKKKGNVYSMQIDDNEAENLIADGVIRPRPDQKVSA